MRGLTGAPIGCMDRVDAAYDEEFYAGDRAIDCHIKRLRKKFRAVDDAFDMIEALYGVGYRFKEL